MIKDAKGETLHTFLERFGIGNNNEAEFRAVYVGSHTIAAKGFDNSFIEGDSKFVMTWLENKSAVCWKLLGINDDIDDALNLKEVFFITSHAAVMERLTH
eukprot:TRINITY_DN26306_c0_g1_i1.p1 TRINITY_DN26306_c0_g1~~TRINITY_DN26306_c0_g1_i1.p1  ORF type:complete len:100 (-),score=17.32 TRINITY_DN26306_c0_g1_i1:85-384(-)